MPVDLHHRLSGHDGWSRTDVLSHVHVTPQINVSCRRGSGSFCLLLQHCFRHFIICLLSFHLTVFLLLVFLLLIEFKFSSLVSSYSTNKVMNTNAVISFFVSLLTALFLDSIWALKMHLHKQVKCICFVKPMT